MTVGTGIPPDSDFTLANLPFGIGHLADEAPRAYVALGDHALDLQALATQIDTGVRADVFARPDLNEFLALGPLAWRSVRECVSAIAVDASDSDLVVRRDRLDMLLPVAVGDYVDMYAGIHHATNLGRLFRPDGEALLPNWRHIPVGYHGRAGTVVASGTEVLRPAGHVAAPNGVAWRPTAQLDVELELGVVIGAGSRRGEPIGIDDVEDHVFGFVLVNDWSARDIQAFEYQPLGPFLGKSFMTSVSPWIVPFDALAPFMAPGLVAGQQPPPAPHLRSDRPGVPQVHCEILLETARMRADARPAVVVAEVDIVDALYWSPAQQVAHATSNGASVRPGDLFASGTLSGADPATQGGSFMELTWRGTQPLELATGETRAFLEDGDRVVLRGWCGASATRVGFGAVEGTVRATGG